MVSFAVTPAAKKPRLTHVVSKVLNSKSAKNLATRFNDEDSTDKVDLPLENLEVCCVPADWTEVESNAPTFAPSVAQWNSLVTHVISLTSKLNKALKAIALVAEISEAHFESVDDPVVHLRGYVGCMPRNLGPNLPGLDLWTNMSKLSDEIEDNQEKLCNSRPSVYETSTRVLADSASKAIRKNVLAIKSLENVKAEYLVGQVKPLEAALEDVVSDLYEPEGTYSTVLMEGFVGGGGGESTTLLQEQYKALAAQ
jgi:hypothetical protein